MAGRDNVLYHATVASGTAAGTVVPLSLLYGVENVRQGYGTAKLKGMYGFLIGGGSNYGDGTGVPIEIKNSNWVDSAGMIAARITGISCNKDSSNYMRGRDKVLQPNTSWIFNATLPYATNAQLDIYLLIEIEYSDVPGVDAEKLAGSPVMKRCTNAAFTASPNVPSSFGSFDNLLQGITYVLSESNIVINGSKDSVFAFLVVEGFSNQRGLIRILPTRNVGLAEQIEGSVYLTKQTFNLAVIPVAAFSASNVTIGLEMIASTN